MCSKREYFFPSTDGIHRIHALEWQPETPPRGVVQIAHGICEYADRYDAFARYLCAQGFAVVANDHLGHGKSWTLPEDQGYFAPRDGWSLLVEDMELLRARTAEAVPGIPYFLLGHSMGSFLARTYLFTFPGHLTGALICGTGQQSPAAVAAGKALTSVLITLQGSHHRSRLVHRLTLGDYNRGIPNPRTPCDWICQDPQVVDAYRADPDCMFLPTLGLYRDLMDGVGRIRDPRNLRKMDPALPILFFSGSEDPVGGRETGVRQVYDSFLQAGCTRLSLKLYPGCRHEVLNELGREQVYADVLCWLEQQLPAPVSGSEVTV